MIPQIQPIRLHSVTRFLFHSSFRISSVVGVREKQVAIIVVICKSFLWLRIGILTFLLLLLRWLKGPTYLWKAFCVNNFFFYVILRIHPHRPEPNQLDELPSPGRYAASAFSKLFHYERNRQCVRALPFGIWGGWPGLSFSSILFLTLERSRPRQDKE